MAGCGNTLAHEAGGAPDDVQALITARGLLAAALTSDRYQSEAVDAIRGLPADVWPDEVTRAAGEAIRRLALEGAVVDANGVLQGTQACKWLSDADEVVLDLSRLIEFSASCNPARDAVYLRERAKRRFFEDRKQRLAVALPGLDRESLRTFLADSDLLGTDGPDLLSITDFSQWRELAMQSIRCVFAGAMPRNTLSILAAEGGVGKSFLALELAISVAIGRELLPGFSPMSEGRSLCLFGEDPPEVVAQRMAAVACTFGIDEAEIDAATSDGRLRFVAGESAPLLEFSRDGRAQASVAHLQLVAELRTLRPDFVVVDPFIAWAGLPTENDNAAMQAVASALIDLARASGGAVLAIHHTSKAGGKNLDQNATRGGSALTCAARWVASMRIIGDEGLRRYNLDVESRSEFVEMAVTKNSYAKWSAAVQTLRREPNGVLVAADLRQEWIGQIAEAIGKTIDAQDARLTGREIARGLGDEAKAVRKLVKQALDQDIGRGVLERAIAFGLESGTLAEVETQPGGGRGAARREVRSAVRFAANGLTGQGGQEGGDR